VGGRFLYIAEQESEVVEVRFWKRREKLCALGLVMYYSNLEMGGAGGTPILNLPD